MQMLSHLFTFLSADMRKNRTWKKDEQSAKPLPLLLKVEALDRSTSITLEVVGDAESQASPKTYQIRMYVLTQSPVALLTHASLRSTCPYDDITEDEANRGIFP